ITWAPRASSRGLCQINQLVLALLALFVWSLASGRAVLGGVALGVATALRVHPALFIGWLAWRGKWRAFAAACFTAVACTALATAAVGWAATVEYVTRVAPQYGYGHVLGQLRHLSLTGWIVATGHGPSPSVPLGAWRTVAVVASVAALAAAIVALRPAAPIAPART